MKCAMCSGKKTLHLGNGVNIACPTCRGAGTMTATVEEHDAAKRKTTIHALAVAKCPPVLRLTIPGEPVPKGRPRFSARRGPGGKTFVKPYTPAETEAYEAKGRLVAEAEARRVGWVVTTADRFTIVVRVFRRHYDAGGDGDNYEKSAIDFLIPKRGVPGSGVIPDDRYVRGGAWSIKQDDVRPRLEIVLSRFRKGAI